MGSGWSRRGSKVPGKKQRRWNTESLRTAEPQNSSIALSENLVQTTLVKPILGRTDSTVSEDAPKESVVFLSKRSHKDLKRCFQPPIAIKGGRLLVADFVDPQQVQAKIDGRELATPVTNPSPAVPPASSPVQAAPAPQQGRKQQVESEHPLIRQPPPAPPIAPPTKMRQTPPVADKK